VGDRGLTAADRFGRIWPTGAVTLALLLGCVAAGCGAEATENGDPTITVASKDTAEEVIIAEIYAQALEASGFKVKRNHRLPAGFPPFDQEGIRLSGYPEHLNIALKDILEIKRDVPGDPVKAYEIAKAGLEEEGLTAFPPTSFSRSKAVGMLRKAAEERGLKTLSGLREQAGEMTVKADDFCNFLTDCLPGFQRFYGISFESFTAIEPVLRYKVLETGEADASIVLSTEGRLAGKNSKFVILEDDKHRLPAGHVFWLTTTDLAEELGPRYEKTIVTAQKGLTLEVMQELNATVKLKKQPPAKVAAEYLKSIGYKGA
jgi:glycine betaine/choline ABC-type transport system substrate-binding protein